MNHNAIFINNYGAGVASVVKLDEQAYNQFTSPNDAEFVKFKKAYADSIISRMPEGSFAESQQDTAPSTLNSRTLLDKVLSSTDPDLQGELEGLSFRVVRGREKYGTEDELYDDGTTDYVVLTAQDGEEKAIRLLEVLKSDVVDFNGLPRWTGGKPRKELGSAGFCARALAKAYQNRGHIVYSHGHVGNGEPAKAVACMCPSGLVALGVIYQPPEVGTWDEDKSMTDIHDAKFDKFFSGEPLNGGEMFYDDVDAFKKWLGNPMQGAEGKGAPANRGPVDPEGLYSFAAENRTTDAGLEKVAIDPTFIENLFLGTKNAPQHTGKYNIESYIVHDSAGRTDYVLMYNKSTGKAGIAPLGVFYGLRLRVTELDDQRFREMVKKYSGAVEAEHRALLSIADGGCTPYKDDQDESIGGISTTIGNKLVDRRMLVSLRSTKNTGTMLYAGDYHGYFNIDRESFINNGYYEYIKNTPYMYTPDDSGDTVELFKDAFYMFTDDEIDWNVLMELLKKLPEGVRIQVPGPFSTGGSFWKVVTVGLVNGRLERI